MNFEINYEIEDLALKAKMAKEVILMLTQEIVNSNDINTRDALGYAIDTLASDIHRHAANLLELAEVQKGAKK